ncbi:MAG: methyltransferase [Robiginitomaculum sp.]|nr:methyltransferase [Robiginitomaculum sp.]MDQ7077133.1 methyltransferase [Robiginitomaculum sp.]
MTEKITFLDGQVMVRQAEGYRAGLDAVLLAAVVRLKSGAKALELGCGAGTALLCAAHQNPQAHFIGLEKHQGAFALARDNVVKNAMQDRVEVVQGSVANPPSQLRPDSFDQVFLNPPYFDDPSAIRRPKTGKDSAFVNNGLTLRDWIDTALRLTRAKGYITLIQRAERLNDCLAGFYGRAGDIRILPIVPRAGEAAHRIIIRARRNVKTPLVILSPLVVHETGRTFTPMAEAIMKGQSQINLGPKDR